jgi:hypothetical protein
MSMLRIYRRTARLACAAVVGALTVIAFGAAPASATVVHHVEGSFKGSEVPGGLSGWLASAAVDQSTGAVWVTESNVFGAGQGVVDRFDENGVYGLTGVQIVGSETPQGSFAMQLFSGTAVDNSAGPNKGDVYVADTEHGVVDRFSAAGAFLCQITGKVPVSAEEIAHECAGARYGPRAP